jgi:hypothetical protein
LPIQNLKEKCSTVWRKVYISANILAESYFADFLGGSLIQKVNSMRQYIGAVRAKNSILSQLCLFVETMPINKAVASRNGNIILTQK